MGTLLIIMNLETLVLAVSLLASGSFSCFTTPAPPSGGGGQNQVLDNLDIDPETISISGFSSGAHFAAQFHVAFSASIKGMGSVEGSTYLSYAVESESQIMEQTRYLESQGLIDSLDNIKNDNIYLFHGLLDSIVPWENVGEMKRFYDQLLSDGNEVELKDDISAEHGFPNELGEGCETLNDPYFVNNCNNYLGAFHILNKTIGNIVIDNSVDVDQVNLQLEDFDQNEFFWGNNALGASLDPKGFIYVPERCKNGNNKCHLHVHFHGCSQTRGQIGSGYVTRTGFMSLAKTNDVVVMFPQITTSFVNLFGCWDFSGYNGDSYQQRFATKEGTQMSGVAKMIERVAGINMF